MAAAESPAGDDGVSPVQLAVLLVGGLGTRLRPLTHKLPKALMPVANLPLIAYEIIPLVRAGVKRIILATGYKTDALRAELGDGSAWGAELVYVEEQAPLDTAGAIGNVRQWLDGPFFALNGDLIYDVDYAALAREHVAREALVTFCLRPTPDIRHFGLIQWEAGGRVTAFKEKVDVDETGRNTVNSGVYVMAPEVLEHIPGGVPYSNERQLFPGLLAAGELLLGHVPERSGYWADVGRIETYVQANRDVLDGRVSWFERRNLGALAPDAVVSANSDIAAGAVVEAEATLAGRVAVGHDCRIEAGATVADSVLWPGTVVGRGAQVRDCVIAGGVVPEGHVVTGEVIVS